MNEIYDNVRFNKLDVFSMMDILLFLGEKYTGERSDFGFYNPSYRNAKNGIVNIDKPLMKRSLNRVGLHLYGGKRN